MKIRKNNRGFTLVELLLVMAIIGILAGVIFVTTAPARKKARITTFKQHMKDLSTAGSSCIDSGGTILGGAADGSSVTLCAALSDDVIPEIKTCKGGAGNVTIAVNGDADNDDFVITSSCPVTGATTTCYAECTVNGCKFGNSADGSGAVTTVDGCPKT